MVGVSETANNDLTLFEKMKQLHRAENARQHGEKQGKELDMSEQTLSEQTLNRNLAEINGGLEGRKLDMNEQSDMVSVNSEDTIEARAHLAWYKWAKENNIDPNTADPETYELMKDAFVDGYLNGFTKRITG